MERARGRIEGFNRETLTLQDLAAHCEDRRIDLVQLPLRRAHGCSIYEAREPMIYINSLLSEPEKIIAGFHEYLHITDGVVAQAYWSTGTFWNLSKLEYQAQVVGVMALMPDELVKWSTEDEICREFNVSRRTARFRLSLFR
ncbi:MAG TPA: ImmA/IrrE family metallo-endopeptidase [Blastocatellia bacterium]|nr:ImmA/IrrE family metallo-endopeptidase [Blastocatellia bacterium]